MPGIIKPPCMLLIALVLVVAVVPRSEAVINCNTVISYLTSCIPYFVSNGPLGRCCGGIKGLYNAAKRPIDRKNVCNCLESFAGKYRSFNLAKASGLPAKCGVRIPYKISPSTDCSKVS